MTIFAQFFSNKLAYTNEDTSVKIQWSVPREKVSEVKEQLDFNGEIIGDESTVEDSKGLPLIYIFVGVVSLGYLSEILLKVYRDVRYGGIIIYSEDNKLIIDNDFRLPSGTIIITQGDNIKVFQDKNKPETTEVINALKILLKK